jgi:riboflavin synthase
MFTGIIEGCSPVRSIQAQGSGIRLWVASPSLPEEPFQAGLGDSIALSGACLTVAGASEPGQTALLDPSGGVPAGADLMFELSRETLERTWFDALEPGRPVNLERAMRLGDRLDGHLVSGHVDGQGRIVASEDSGDGGRLFTFEVEEGFERYLIEKGSVTIDGISLTVVEPRGRIFQVAVIPLTLELTSLGLAKVGDRVNLEADMIGKWIERLVPR